MTDFKVGDRVKWSILTGTIVAEKIDADGDIVMLDMCGRYQFVEPDRVSLIPDTITVEVLREDAASFCGYNFLSDRNKRIAAACAKALKGEA